MSTTSSVIRASRCAISARTTSSSCRSPSTRFAAETTAALWKEFHDAHHARFGFDIPGETIEIVNFWPPRLDHAEAELPRDRARRRRAAAPVGAAHGGLCDGRHDMPVFRRDALRAGHRIAGPAIVEEAASVTVLNPVQRLAVDPYGHLVIEHADA